MAGRMELSLRNFFIFNTQFGQNDGEEEEKIFFYHPSDIDMDTKVKDVGLSEAIIKFTNTFTQTDGCQILNTQKTTQIFYQAEKDFWMVMTLNVPCETKVRDGGEYVEYRGGDIHGKIYRAILRQAYQMFRLFAGTFQFNFTGDEEIERAANLKKKLEVFYSKYLLTLKLKTCDILDVVQSLQYLPLEKALFLRIHTFINMIEETFPKIENCIFLYNDQLVWSEVNTTDLYSIYEYLIGTLLQKAKETELQGGSLSRSYSMDGGPHYGAFITGPESQENATKAPKVFIYNGMDMSSYFMVVYRALTATICLLVNAESQPTEEFYGELHSFMGPQLSSIASRIGETFTKTSTPNSKAPTDPDSLGPRYLFINELSLRHSGSAHLHPHRSSTQAVPLFVTNLITDLYNEKKDIHGKFQETVIKALNDYWIVKRTSNWRQFYVIINNNKATLLDITNEANKIFEQEITNVFFEK